MSKRPKKNGRSKDMRDKQRLEREHGELKRDGRDWSQQETDELLNLYLTDGRGLQAIALIIQRPFLTVENKIWKLATGYMKNRQYCPGEHRKEPRPGPLGKREIQMLEFGLFGGGQEITKDRPRAVDVEHMARVLNRPASVVQRYYDRKRFQPKGFF